MKRKILAFAIVGIFLMVGTTTVSALEIKVSDIKKQIQTTNDVKIVNVGSVKIRGDGTLLGSSVEITIQENKQVIISGKTTVKFSVDYDIECSKGVGGVGFNVIVGDWEFISGERQFIFDKDTLYSEEKEVDKGDIFIFEIHAAYIYVLGGIFIPGLKGDSGKFRGQGVSKNKQSFLIEFINQKNTPVLNNLFRTIIQRYPIIAKIL
jgi:hypothetical protein